MPLDKELLDSVEGMMSEAMDYAHVKGALGVVCDRIVAAGTYKVLISTNRNLRETIQSELVRRGYNVRWGEKNKTITVSR